MALESVCVTCSCPTTSLNRCGRYFRAMTWYDISIFDLRYTIYAPLQLNDEIVSLSPLLVNRKSQIVNKSECQGDHGGCRANCRCCIPALAGFVSPHSMGPGTKNVPQLLRGIKEKCLRGGVI